MPLPQIYQPKCAADVAPETRAIFFAIKARDVRAVQAIVDAGDDLSITSHFKYTPLHYACWLYAEKAGSAGICMPTDLGLIIQALVEGGASLTVRDSLGNIPNALLNGHGPRFLSGLMQELADQDTWPEVEPSSDDEEDGRQTRKSPIRRASFVPKASYTGKKKKRKTAVQSEAA